MELSKNPLKEHYKGLPCMLDEIVGRIVGEHESGSWNFIDGKKVFSIPLMATPHGSIIASGRVFLSEITEEGMKQLLEYEEKLKKDGKQMYGGFLEE